MAGFLKKRTDGAVPNRKPLCCCDGVFATRAERPLSTNLFQNKVDRTILQGLFQQNWYLRFWKEFIP